MQTKLLKTFVTLATLACSLAVSAHDFEYRGIFYNITDALCEGNRVQLDGLGSLTMELSSHTGPTPPTGKDVKISGIRFRPDKHLLDRLTEVKFKVEGKVRQPLAAPELADALYEHFETHDDISVRDFASISHYALSTSYQKLADYVAHGELEPVPRIKGCYRPTPGHFGREE